MESIVFCPLPCRLCKRVVAEGGVRASRVDQDKLSKWWLLHMDTQLEDEDLERVWICYFCTSHASLVNAEHKNYDWWTNSVLESPVYLGFQSNSMSGNLMYYQEQEVKNNKGVGIQETPDKLLKTGFKQEQGEIEVIDLEDEDDKPPCHLSSQGANQDHGIGLKGEETPDIKQAQEQKMLIDDESRKVPLKNLVGEVGEELRPIGAPKEKWTVEDEKPSLHRKLEECEKLVKEKEEKMEIIAGKLKSMKKQLDEAIEAKSEADLTVCVLNDYIKSLEEKKKEKGELPDQQLDSFDEATEDDDEDYEEESRKRKRKRNTKNHLIPNIPRKHPKPLKVCATDSTKYELCLDFLVSKEKVNSLPENVTMAKFVGKLMEYKYESEKEAYEHLSKFSLRGKPFRGKEAREAKLMYPVAHRNALFEAANLKFVASHDDIEAIITRKLNTANTTATGYRKKLKLRRRNTNK